MMTVAGAEPLSDPIEAPFEEDPAPELGDLADGPTFTPPVYFFIDVEGRVRERRLHGSSGFPIEFSVRRSLARHRAG